MPSAARLSSYGQLWRGRYIIENKALGLFKDIFAYAFVTRDFVVVE